MSGRSRLAVVDGEADALEQRALGLRLAREVVGVVGRRHERIGRGIPARGVDAVEDAEQVVRPPREDAVEPEAVLASRISRA